MRAIPDDFDPAVVAEIDGRLAAIQDDHGVSIPWAIESGSRAWGFASLDSDYDCRFFYVRPKRSYLDLWPDRDVIETPLVGLLDVNGWDLGKAVRLAVEGNATVGEWLRSPTVYLGEEAFRDQLIDLVASVATWAASDGTTSTSVVGSGRTRTRAGARSSSSGCSTRSGLPSPCTGWMPTTAFRR